MDSVVGDEFAFKIVSPGDYYGRRVDEYSTYGMPGYYFLIINEKIYAASDELNDLENFMASQRKIGRKAYYDSIVDLFKSGDARYLLPYDQWDTAEVQTALNSD